MLSIDGEYTMIIVVEARVDAVVNVLLLPHISHHRSSLSIRSSRTSNCKKTIIPTHSQNTATKSTNVPLAWISRLDVVRE